MAKVRLKIQIEFNKLRKCFEFAMAGFGNTYIKLMMNVKQKSFSVKRKNDDVRYNLLNLLDRFCALVAFSKSKIDV